MPTEPRVLETTRFVVENAREVTIDPRRVEEVAAELAARPAATIAYDCARHVCGTDPVVANVVLVVDTLNFSFWPDPGQARWRVTDNGETLDGYWALVAAVRRALDEGVPIADAAYLSGITTEVLGHVLRGEGTIPLLAERTAALREVGAGLLKRDGGWFTGMIARAGFDAPRLVGLLATEFSSFDDVASYDGRRVELYKRAQICCGDLNGASEGAPWGALKNLDRLTAFADYKVPQVLRRLGLLVYADDLAHLVDSRIRLAPGSASEVEIRAATIWAVELLRRALANRGVHRTAVEIDWLLWELGQMLPPDAKPYHLTRTVYY
jgi:hypothetical protein